MLRIYYGPKGTGKSKRVIGECNDRVERANGTVVYIDDDSAHSTEISHKVRFIDASEYGINEEKLCLGFICGIIAQDHDLEAIYLDGFAKIVPADLNKLGDFFSKLHLISEKNDIDVFMSINGETGEWPEFLKPYIVEV